MSEREQLERAIDHLETQRAPLGDTVVDVSIVALRSKLAALKPISPPISASRLPFSLPTSRALRPCPKRWTPRR